MSSRNMAFRASAKSGVSILTFALVLRMDFLESKRYSIGSSMVMIVFGTGLIYHVYHGGESGGLALTDGTYYQEESLRLPGESLQDGRQIELGKGANSPWG